MKSNKFLFTWLCVFFLSFSSISLGPMGLSQQLPTEQAPVNVAGKWMLYTLGEDGKTGTHTVDIEQNGNTLTGHFKGPYQSGGIEGTINVRHILFRTKTRNVLTFRGMVDGNTMKGKFGVRGRHGTWEARRAD